MARFSAFPAPRSVYPSRLYAAPGGRRRAGCDGGLPAVARNRRQGGKPPRGAGLRERARAPPEGAKKAGRPGAARLAWPVAAGAQKLSRAPSWMRQRDIPFSMLKPTGSEV